MPPTKKSSRQSQSKLSRALLQQFADLRRSLDQALQANRRQQRLRRQRQQQRPTTPPGEQQLLALKRALQFRGLQRRLQRRQSQEQDGKRGLGAWFWPPTGAGLTTRDSAALLLRHAATALLLLILISLVINAIPFQLGSPSWYLQVLAYIAENVPVLVLGSGFALVSLVFSDDDASFAYRAKLLRISRLGYILALVLLPLQLGFTSWLYGQAFSADRTQRTAIRANADALISGAQQASTTEQFVAYLRSRNLSANLESIAAAPLAQVRTEFIRSVKVNQQQQEQRLGANTRTTFLRYTTTSIKLFVTLVVLAGFMRVFQALVRRCRLERPSNEQPTDQPAEAGSTPVT
jgi:hypothetical protein